MPTTNLGNITIKEKQDIKGKTYYLIVNNENQDEAYFCFAGMVKNGWEELVNNWEQIKEVEIEYTESEQGFRVYRRVVGLVVPEREIVV